MRTRKQIEESMMHLYVDFDYLAVELLLDIRDLLTHQDN